MCFNFGTWTEVALIFIYDANINNFGGYYTLIILCNLKIKCTFARSKGVKYGIAKNIAIIAHIDRGKTTLVDKILYHCQLFRENENTGDLILDNNDLERERGITITSKNVFSSL